MLSLPVTYDTLMSGESPRHLVLPRGMLVESEVRFLHQLMRDVYEGAGEVIDAGAFCGASAYAMAAGLNENPRIQNKSGRITSFDLFRCDEPYTLEYVQNIFYSRFDEHGNKLEPIAHVAPGQSFREVFEFQTSRYKDLIAIEEGSFLDKKWDGRPIEVLFIDVAKTVELQMHLFATMLPCLIPGKSILIQQDFHHPWHPYIHSAMQYLKPWFEIILSSAGATRAYRLTSQIPAEALDKVARHAFTVEEEASLIRQTVEDAPVPEKMLMVVTLARLLHQAGRIDACIDVIEDARRTYPPEMIGYFDYHFSMTCPNALAAMAARPAGGTDAPGNDPLQASEEVFTPATQASAQTANFATEIPAATYALVGYDDAIALLLDHTKPGYGMQLEAIVQKLYEAILKPGDGAIDGGCNAGHHSFPMWRCVGATGKVISIDANAEPLEALKWQKGELVGAENIEVVHGALTPVPGDVEFTCIEGESGWSGLKVTPWTPVHLERNVKTVQGYTIDQIAQRLPPLGFIKLDLEGADFEALRGASRVLSTQAPPIVFENSGESGGKLYNHSYEDMAQFFDRHDYNWYDLFGRPMSSEAWQSINVTAPPEAFAVRRGSESEAILIETARTSVQLVATNLVNQGHANAVSLV